MNQTAHTLCRRSVLGQIFFLLLIASTSGLSAADARLDGQAVNNATREPVAGATVTLDANPPDGMPEYTIESGPFGFFKLTDVPPGGYRLAVESPGFLRHEESINFLDADRKTKQVKLLTGVGTVTFDVFFQVWCKSTSKRLVGAVVTTEYWEPDGTLTGPADKTFIKGLDVNGSTVFPALMDGFYKFKIEIPGWRTNIYVPPPGGGFITSGDKVRLTTSHFASVSMQPIPDKLSIAVHGYDPVKDLPDQPLAGMVLNLTGIDPTDDTVLVPTMSAVTAKDGIYVFPNLPPIDYKLTIGRLGYVPKEVLISPGGDGKFATNLFNVDLEPTKVKAVLTSPYDMPDLLRDATILLRGITNANTAGINRDMMTTSDPGANTASALFENLLPGRYWMHVVHHTTASGFPGQAGPIFNSPTSFQISFFPHETFSDPQVGLTEEVIMDMKPVPAVVRGRLWATDELGNRDTEPFNPEPNRIFHQKAQDGIQFIEHELINILGDPDNMVTVNTDASGNYTAHIIPGIFGVKIPGMADYTGHNVEFGNISANQPTFTRPWPYAELWPFGQFEFGHHGPGLAFNSAQEYQLDLFTHRHYVNVCGQVTSTGDPFGSLILRMDADGSNVVGVDYNHFLDTGAQVSISGPVSKSVDIQPDGHYVIPDLVPGTYTVSLSHPDYTAPPTVFTVAPWDPPGILPSVGPGQASYYFPGITHCYNGAFQQIFDFEAEWKYPGSVRVKRYNYDAGQSDYNSAGTSSADYFRVQGLPDRLFSYSGIGVPNGLYTVWERHGNGWFSDAATGETTFDGALEGGPLDNTIPDNPPTPDTSYTLDLHAVSRADPTMEISNVTVSFNSGSDRQAGGTVPHDGSPYPSGATHADGQWIYFGGDAEVVDTAARLVRTTVLMNRAMVVSGLVESDGFPVPEAAVVIRNRYGNPVGRSVTDQNGNYSVGSLVPQPVYVDVSRRGFVQQRKRFNPPSPANPDIAANFDLVTVPPPTISSFTMNRFGLFLPGVSKSGDSTGFNPENARERLKMTWKATASDSTYEVTLDGFYNPDETQKTPETTQVTDPVSEVWIVDRRSFTNTFTGKPDVNPLPMPATTNYVTISKWLSEIVLARKGGVPYYVVHDQVLREEDNPSLQYEGSLNVWELPAGEFKPCVVAITRNGGVAIKDYQVPSGKPSLQGMDLPQWVSGLLESVGFMANLPGVTADAHAHYGDGFLKIGEGAPKFEARIGLDPFTNMITADNALTYKYVIGLDLALGDKSAAGGPMAFGPKLLGLSIQGYSLEFEVAGADKKAALAFVLGTTSDDQTIKEEEAKRNKNYKPPVLPEKEGAVDFDISSEVAFKLGAFTELDANWLGESVLSKLGVVLEAQGLVKTKVEANATPVLGKIPYAGPVLIVLDKSGGLTVLIVGELDFGAKATYEVTTQFPKPTDGGTRVGGVDAPPQSWDFLGSLEDNAEFKYILRIAAGLKLSAAGGTIDGTALVQVGAPTGVPDTDGVFFTVNRAKEGPWYKKIEGAVSIVLRAGVNLWTVKIAKRWQWDINRFIIEPEGIPDPPSSPAPVLADYRPVPKLNDTGDATFDLYPMNITYTEITASASMQQTFAGVNGLLVDDFYEAGSYAVTSEPDPLLVFTGIDGTTGEMTVIAVPQSGGVWGTPVELARAGGVISVATAPLAGGGWLVAWSEIDVADLYNPFPATRIRYVFSDSSGNNWSAPSTVTTSAEAVFDLKLASAGSTLLLGYQSTAEGPLGENRSLFTTIWNGATWSAPFAQLPGQTFREFDMAGQDDGTALLVAADANSDVFARRFNGTAWDTEVSVLSGTKGFVSLKWIGPGFFVMLSQNDDDRAVISIYDWTQDSWTHLLPELPTLVTDDLHILPLSDNGAIVFLLVWTAGGDTTSIWHAYIDEFGDVLLPPRETTLDSHGQFSRLAVRPVAGFQAAITAQYLEGNSSIREYVVGLPLPGDCDGNGIADAVEIANGWATDQNNNGIPDECEIADGLLIDRDRNGVADLFEPAVAGDCNRNGIADSEEIFLGIATDANNNGVPDECERVTTTVPLETGVPRKFYRATRIVIKTITVDDIELEYEGELKSSENVTGPWTDPQP